MHRLATLVLIAAACGGARTTSPGLQGGPPPGTSAARGVMPDGDYACTITSDGYTYQPYLCRVSTQGDAIKLVKLEGSQRVRGALHVAGDAATFDGEFYCNGGGCERPVHATFAPAGAGAWAGDIGNGDSLRLEHRPAGMYGGAGYGADAWADDGYGGDSYGGFGYGGFVDP